MKVVTWRQGLNHAAIVSQLRFALIALLPLSPIAVLCAAAFAQITPDRTLGSEQSTVNQSRIEGGARRSTNLFHSFEQFNVGDGQRIDFASPAGITNIISRVTGQEASNILGTLGVQGSANLFFLNPNGIVFGKNARLDIKGSFIATTASQVRFADGTEFQSANPAPLLTISTPIGLQVGTNPGSIRVQGNGQGLRSGNNTPEIDTNEALRVPTNRTLALIGGPIVAQGATLKTAGGRLELASLAEPGFVAIAPDPKGFSFSYNPQSVFGDIQLSGATAIDATGRTGGVIQVHARQLTMQGGSVLENSILGNGAGGSVTVNASESVELSGSTADNPGDTRQFVTSLSLDNRGTSTDPVELTINTGRLTLRNGARISASNSREGIGGSITVNARDRIELIGTGVGPGGLRSSGISVQTRGAGRAGDLRIVTKQLSIQSGAEASASTFGAGAGGNVEIQATERVELSGTSSNRALRSRIAAEVGNPNDVRRRGEQAPGPPATGRGGDVKITTRQLAIQDDATISVSSPNGQAGNVKIGANTVKLNRGRLTAEAGAGSGADIEFQQVETLLLRNNSLVSAKASNNATGGNIAIDAANGFVIAVPDQNNDIIANASRGRGGAISITTQGIFGIAERRAVQNRSNDIDASSEFNQSGTVSINRPDVDPTQGLTELPSEPRAQQPLVSCQPGGVTAGRFVMTGRGGLPPQPDEALSSLESLDDLALPTQWQAAKAEVNPMAEAQGWMINSKGQVELVTGQILQYSCSSDRSRN